MFLTPGHEDLRAMAADMGFLLAVEGGETHPLASVPSCGRCGGLGWRDDVPNRVS